jgi:tRNA (cmo5U34)-methyltransferase
MNNRPPAVPRRSGTNEGKQTMRSDEIKALFDQQAASYDAQWAKTAPIRDGLLFLLEAVFAGLPDNARLLCVGVGTGEEIAYMAKRFPHWTFTAVEPSGTMLGICRQKAEMQGFASRCYFHEGYLDSLPMMNKFDASTCFLVSQFILEREARSAFFQAIAARLRAGAILASSDLAANVDSPEYEAALGVWLNMMASIGIPPEGLERMRAAYAKDVAILPPAEVASVITAGGFENPVVFFQAGLIHAWFSKCTSDAPELPG